MASQPATQLSFSVTTLAFGSSQSIRDLFEQIVNMVPEGEDGFTILRAVLNAPVMN